MGDLDVIHELFALFGFEPGGVHFFADIGESSVIKDVGGSVSNLAHQDSGAAEADVRAFIAFAKVGFAVSVLLCVL